MQGVTAYPVSFKALEKFNEARKKLTRLVQDNGMHEVWAEGLKLFGTIHAKIARTPCRPSWIAHEILHVRKGQSVIDKLSLRLQAVDRCISDTFLELQTSLGELTALHSNPLLGPVKDVKIDDGVVLFVLRDLRLWEEARLCISSVVESHSWEIVKPSSLRNQRQGDCLFIFGPVWYLTHRREEYLLRAPAAGRVNLISCEHEFSGGVTYSYLHITETIPLRGDRPRSISESASDFEPIASDHRGVFRFKDFEVGRVWESGNNITAVPFKLGAGQGTYFANSSSVWVVSADCSGSCPVCSGVDKIPVDDLEAGSLLLMTTSGGGDMIPVVADMILPDSRRIRELQVSWKTSLVRQVEAQGLSETAAHLKSLGAQKASALNLKNWCNPRSIGMEHLDTDLLAVLKLTGLEARHTEIREAIELLRGAHQSAGAQLQKKLRESLLGMDLGEVFRRGRMEIKHGDGPAKTVFLVEERGMEAEIPEEWEGELRDIDE